MRLAAKRRTNRAGYDGIDAQRRPMLPLIGKFVGERGNRCFRHRIPTPIRARLLTSAVEREDHACIGCACKERHRDPGQSHRRGHVHAEKREPVVEGLMLERTKRAKQRGSVHQRVESSELRVERARDIREIGGFRTREVERENDGFGRVRRDDLVVERFELAHDATVDHHGSARSGTRERKSASYAAGSAGDEHDTSIKRR